jgi:hypothetical protein
MPISPQAKPVAKVGLFSASQVITVFAVLSSCVATPACAQIQTQPQTQETAQVSGPQRIEILLDRREGAGWHPVDPGLVFAQNDRVRFRFRTNFAGYLYVMNQSTSGKYEALFPREDTGEENRVEAGKEYIVPATQGWFRIAGPPGLDILYWMVTPLPLGAAPKYVPLPPPPKPGAVPPRLAPRCDGTLFKARGECIDSSAGMRGVPREETLPGNLKALPNAGSRELLFIREKDLSVAASPGPLSGPVIYEFRLAHR